MSDRRRFPRKIDAERFLAHVDNEAARSVFVDPQLGRLLLDRWAARWIETVSPAHKPKTVASYESLINSRILPRFGSVRVANLSPSHVQEWINLMKLEGISSSRIRQAHVTLKQILDLAVRDGALGRNVAVGMKLPKLEQYEAPYLEPDVVDRIAAAHQEPYDLLLRLMGVLGLRWGEVAALRRRHVDLLRRRLRIEESLAEIGGRIVAGATKTHAVRTLPLSPNLAAALESHLATLQGGPDRWLFTSPKGSVCATGISIGASGRPRWTNWAFRRWGFMF